MPQDRSTNRSKSRRSFDAESRKSRLGTKQMHAKQRPIQEESDSDDRLDSDSDSELEEQLNIQKKDDTRKVHFRESKPRKYQESDTASQTAVHSQSETKSAEQQISSALHMILRSSVYHMRIAPITFPNVSTYVPSFYMFFEALDSAHLIVHNNTYLKYICADYISVASKLYYAILAYIQILRAKEFTGTTTRLESQVLKRFERLYGFESLPVMSPLLMFFQNLGAVKLADPMYSFICPTLPTTLGTGTTEIGIFARSSDICLPNVPALIRFLYEIGTAQNVAAISNRTGFLTPASHAAQNNGFFGINFAQGYHTDQHFQRLVHSAGWSPPPEIPSSIDLTTIARIRRWNLPQLSDATNLSTIGQFLQAEGNIEWFKSLVNIATMEAKFFKGSTNFANVPQTSGLSSLVEVKYVNATRPEFTDSIYPMQDGTYSSSIWDFNISTTRGETTDEENRIGATTQFLVTQFNGIVPTNTQGPAPTQSGPYFGTPAIRRQVDQFESDVTRSPKTAFEQIIRENLFDVSAGQPTVR